MRSSSRWAASALLVAVIVAAVVGNFFDRSFPRSPGRAGLLDGGWTGAWQRAYERALPLRDGAIAFWTLLRYSVFREAMPEVLVGSDGWLFTVEEFEPPADLSVPLADAVSRIISVRDALAAKGIDLVVALVPTKTSVQGMHLGRYRVPPALDKRYEEAGSALHDRGIMAPDLRVPMRNAAAGADMYMRTDTHWTPQGARTAASVLAEVIVPLLEKHHSPRIPFETVPGPHREVAGDLLKFVPLGPWQKRGPRPDTVREIVVASGETPVAAAQLFAAPDIPVALVGTSYSTSATSGFTAALKDALDADVLSVAQEGKGPFAPMDAYLEGPAIDDPKPDIVVWEIPVRYLIPDSE